MMNNQYGSFQIQSSVMNHVLEALNANTDKKFFIVVGDVGTGKTTMLNHINKVVFNNAQSLIFDEVSLPETALESAIVGTSKEGAYEVIRRFDKKLTHIVEMPALSERKADIVIFSNFFIEVLSLMNDKKNFKLTEKASEKLLHYTWPGNFHELESVLERAFENALAGESKSTIEPEHIELNIQTKQLEFSIGQKLDEVERKYILQTLYFVHQNRTRAAEILGISIRTLRNKINQYREEGYL
ncbi:MAG: helix-turn-helix domain-containing protein [Pseudobdellovibrio sp.]